MSPERLGARNGCRREALLPGAEALAKRERQTHAIAAGSL